MNEYIADKQFIDLSQIKLNGKILDVGGGGEGIISRHSGDSVVAIDLRKDELKETADIGLKIVMDACNMNFIDSMFDSITSFYTIMYMDLEHTKAFLKEAYRVLKPNGILWIWDTNIPRLNENEVFIVPLEIKLISDEVITTGYGVGGSKEQTSEILHKHITDVGFTIENNLSFENRFEFCCRKN